MNIPTTDHAAAQDSLTARTVSFTAERSVEECAALLRILGHHESAAKLLRYKSNVERRIRARSLVAIHEREAA